MKFLYSLMWNESQSLFREGKETANYQFPYPPKGYIYAETIENAYEHIKERFYNTSNGEWVFETFEGYEDNYAKVTFQNEEDVMSVVFELDLAE